jgi:hypothetical protein
MLRDFFASKNFLALLRFWDEARRGGAVADWNGDPVSIPDHLRQRVVIVEPRGADLVYRYVGISNQRQFGRDPTGATVAETLSADYAAYLGDLADAALPAAAPIFSTSILRRDDLLKRTGRLLAPFSLRGSAAPCLTMSVHLEVGDAFKVTEVVEPGAVFETERYRIAAEPDAYARLAEAGRYYQLSRGMPDRGLASEWDQLAARLEAEIAVPLPCFRGGRPQDGVRSHG